MLNRAPARSDVLHRLGLLAARASRHEEAALWLEAAVEADPSRADAHADLGRALRRAGRMEDAAAHFDRAVALRPGDVAFALPALLHRGTTLDAQHRLDEALSVLLQAAEAHPDQADAWVALGILEWRMFGPAQAEGRFQRALQIDPTRPEVVEHFARTLQEQNRFADASIAFEQLFRMQPQRPLTAGRLLHNKMLMADWTAIDQLQAHVEAELAAGRLASEPFGPLGYCATPEILLQGTSAYAAANFPDRSNELPQAQIGHGPRIRVGYVGGEFREQATASLLTEVLERHDRARFDVYLFDNGWDDGGPLRRRIDTAAREVVPIRQLDDAGAAHAVRDRGVDILVNLNGYFGLARNAMFSLRPAPIQVNYLGFPGTLGAPWVDYVIGDPVVTPLSDQPFYREKIAHLPVSYQPNDRQRPIADICPARADVGLPPDGFVFCCMNNVFKITPVIFDVWMRLLGRVPGSVLWLYGRVPEARENLRREAVARGIDGERIVFAEPLEASRHLARLRLADLFLDTWPCNAHTTGSDALWAGLPLVTCKGRVFSSRVGASMLHAAGLAELVTESLANYESLAYALATEPARLAATRTKLQEGRHLAPLFDSARYAAALDELYARMVERARAALPPVSLPLS